MNQYQRPLVYYWKAHYNDGTYLSQFHPPDYQGEKFDNIDSMYLVFKNLETDKINVLVKKDSEHYKLIEA